jgi:hypothetical protein
MAALDLRVVERALVQPKLAQAHAHRIVRQRQIERA